MLFWLDSKVAYESMSIIFLKRNTVCSWMHASGLEIPAFSIDSFCKGRSGLTIVVSVDCKWSSVLSTVS